jgi:nucleotide-binding universal stress UspA family protein
MKKVCIALDYNPSARKIAETGHKLAKSLDAELTLVHVITDAAYYAVDYAPFMGFETPFMHTYSELAEDLRLGADKYLSASAQHLGSRSIKTAVLEGETADAILDYASDQYMDLLVIGTHSHTGLENILMGNTAVRIVKHSKIPILVVPV